MTPRENGFISEILVEQGYNTCAIGKRHVAQPSTEHPAGPYTQWPLGRGFERYYGFLPGETDQWHPDLTYDNHAHTPPATPEEGYHVSKDLADMSIQFIGDAGNTPFRRWKKEAYRGGTSDPFIISWPAGIKSRGEIRRHFGHAIDMVPTALDLIGIDPPEAIKGVKQSPLEGVSLKSTIDDADAEEVHIVQYFEMLGCRSIYKDGWRAECGWPGPDFTTAIKNVESENRRAMSQQ